MKKTLILLGLVACIAAPVPTKADPMPVRKSNHAVRSSAKPKKAAALKPNPNSETIYITNQPVTGSHLPLVLTRYQGRFYSSSPLAVYDRFELDRTGQLSVGGELLERDPSISSVGIGHR